MNGQAITVLPASHVVPTVGYRLDSGKCSLVYTGNTSTQNFFWGDIPNKISNFGYLIIETAFSNADKELAVLSKRLCPNLLAEELLYLNTRHKYLYRI